MRTMLEFKEILRRVYSKYEVFILPVVKFLLALITLLAINSKLGYMEAVDNSGVVLIASLLCSFLPTAFVVLFGALFILLHFYALAMDVALVGLCVFLIMGLLFLRFTPKDALYVILTPICFQLNIPYVIPVCAGLAGTPSSAVSVGCGVVVHYLINYVSNNATVIGTMDDSEAIERIRLLVDYLIGNRSMLMAVIAFSLTVVIVYIIRRMPIDYNWPIAIVAGAMADAVILLVGDLMFDTNVPVIGVLLGSIVAILISLVLMFFLFSVDYRRTEKVQFEDDEYYYYVKAVPKMTVAAPAKTVKKINSASSKSVGSRTTGTRTTSARTTGVRTTGATTASTSSKRTVGTDAAARYNSARPAGTTTGRTSVPEPAEPLNPDAFWEDIDEEYIDGEYTDEE